MRCDVAQRALSESMDEGHQPSADVAVHVQGCAPCARFERGTWRLRELTRIAVAPEVPDLVGDIMARIRDELGVAPPRPAIRRRAWRPWAASPVARAAVVALIVGFAAGAILTRGALLPRQTISPALATEIPSRLVRAAEELRGYRATFDITELNWTHAVPRRSFVAEIAFRAPEAFKATVRDTTRYPSAAWPRNDLQLVTDGRAWRATGPEPCPRAALPACPRAAPADRTVSGRAPFDAATPMPTDVIVPMTVLAASGRVDVAGEGTAGGRDAVIVRLNADDAGSLFQYLRFMGSWRPFFPQDRVVLWLDRQTWFPLRYEVFPAEGAERSVWSAQNGFPAERSNRAIFTATIRTFSQRPPADDLFAVAPGTDRSDQGFRDGAPTSAVRPTWVGAMRPWRSGTFARTPTRPVRQTVVAYASGLSWVTVTRVEGWNQRRPFGVGAFAEPVTLANGTALYEPASASDPRRLSLHTSEGEFLVATNLPRATLMRMAGSLPLITLREPQAWRIHRWAGGVVEDGLTPAEGLRRAGFATSVPRFLPDGYVAAVARLVRTPDGTTLTIVFRRPAAELGGAGLAFTQGTGQTLAPPSEVGVAAVSVGAAAGRWSPQQHLLEWTSGSAYRSLSSPTLGLPVLIRIAESMSSISNGATP